MAETKLFGGDDSFFTGIVFNASKILQIRMISNFTFKGLKILFYNE